MGKALTRAQRLSTDPEFMRELRETVAENNTSVYRTDGAAIAEQWGSDDYVETGAMRASMTNAGDMPATVTRRRIILRARPKYAKYHRRAIYGWTVRARESVAAFTARILARTAQTGR
jgi:hypothetical protein